MNANDESRWENQVSTSTLIENIIIYYQNLKYFKDQTLIKEIISNALLIKENLTCKPLSLIFLGGVSSGKTSFINKIISFDPANNSLKNEYLQILPTNDQENTAYIWTIAKSLNDTSEVFDGKQTFTFPDAKSLKQKTQELNNLQIEELQNIKTQKISEPKEIKIKIPVMIENFVILDFPGITCDVFKENLLQRSKHEQFAFVFMKSYDDKEKVNESILETIKTLAKPGKENGKTHSFSERFFIVFTKKDKVFQISNEEKYDAENDDDEDDENKKIKKLKEKKLNDALSKSNENIESFRKNGIPIKNVYAFNLMDLTRKTSEKSLKEMEILKRFFKNLEETRKEYHEINMHSVLIQLKGSIWTFAMSFNDAPSPEFLNKESKFFLEESQKYVSEFFEDLSDFDSFKKYHPDLFSEIQKIIESEIKHETKFRISTNLVRLNYLEKISKLCIQKIFEEIYKMIMESVRKRCFFKFLDKLSLEYGIDRILKALNLVFREDAEKEKDFSFIQEEFERQMGFHYFAYLFTGVFLIDLLIVVISAFFKFWQFVGLWSENSCVDDITKIVCQVIEKEKKQFIKSITDDQKLLADWIHDKIQFYLTTTQKQNEEILREIGKHESELSNLIKSFAPKKTEEKLSNLIKSFAPKKTEEKDPHIWVNTLTGDLFE